MRTQQTNTNKVIHIMFSLSNNGTIHFFLFSLLFLFRIESLFVYLLIHTFYNYKVYIEKKRDRCIMCWCMKYEQITKALALGRRAMGIDIKKNDKMNWKTDINTKLWKDAIVSAINCVICIVYINITLTHCVCVESNMLTIYRYFDFILSSQFVLLVLIWRLNIFIDSCFIYYILHSTVLLLLLLLFFLFCFDIIFQRQRRLYYFVMLLTDVWNWIIIILHF